MKQVGVKGEDSATGPKDPMSLDESPREVRNMVQDAAKGHAVEGAIRKWQAAGVADMPLRRREAAPRQRDGIFCQVDADIAIAVTNVDLTRMTRAAAHI